MGFGLFAVAVVLLEYPKCYEGPSCKRLPELGHELSEPTRRAVMKAFAVSLRRSPCDGFHQLPPGGSSRRFCVSLGASCQVTVAEMPALEGPMT